MKDENIMRIIKENNGFKVTKALKIEMFDGKYYLQSNMVKEILCRVPSIQKRISEFFLESKQEEVLVTANKTYISFDGVNHLLNNIIALNVHDTDNCVDWQQEFTALRRELLITPLKGIDFPQIDCPKLQKYMYQCRTRIVDIAGYCIRTCVPISTIRSRFTSMIAEAGLKQGEDYYYAMSKDVVGYYEPYAKYFLTLSGCFKFTAYLLDFGHDSRRMKMGMLSLFYFMTNNQSRVNGVSAIEYVKNQISTYRRPLYDGDVTNLDPNTILAIHEAKIVTVKKGLFEKINTYQFETFSITGLARIAEIDETALKDFLLAFQVVSDFNGRLVPVLKAVRENLVVPDDGLEFERFRITKKGAHKFAEMVINQHGTYQLKQNA